MIPRFVCRHEGDPAVAAVETPSGCVAFPDDKQQFLCPQHTYSLYDGTDGDYEVIWVHPSMADRV